MVSPNARRTIPVMPNKSPLPGSNSTRMSISSLCGPRRGGDPEQILPPVLRPRQIRGSPASPGRGRACRSPLRDVRDRPARRGPRRSPPIRASRGARGRAGGSQFYHEVGREVWEARTSLAIGNARLVSREPRHIRCSPSSVRQNEAAGRFRHPATFACARQSRSWPKISPI